MNASEKVVAVAMGIALVGVCIVLSLVALSRQSASGRRLDELERGVQTLEAGALGLDKHVRQVRSALASQDVTRQSERKATQQAIRDLQAESGRRFDEMRQQIAQANRAELNRLKARQDALEAYWVQKGELLPPISRDLLRQGYVLQWEGDESLPLAPAGGAVVGLPDGSGILLAGGAHLRSSAPATALSTALADAGDFSLEVILKPADLKQDGPARIVSISRDAHYRNLTLGQTGSGIVVRLRTTKTNANGTDPNLEISKGALNGERQHVVFVREGENHSLYVDGELVVTTTVPGDLSTWDHTMPLLVGNEVGGNRIWQGEIYRVCFFTRALAQGEVRQRFVAEGKGR